MVGKFLRAHRDSIVHVEAHDFSTLIEKGDFKKAENIADFAIKQMLREGGRNNQMVPIAFGPEQVEFNPASDPRNHRLKIVFLTLPAPQSEGADTFWIRQVKIIRHRRPKQKIRRSLKASSDF
jgi:hypothetical protein